ncbi:MAG TPA: hypothetical protein VLL96_03520, partial [Candidatus Deferrimicrobiaceae bacterium]|nr:hypothetical protein [Candidatus Deferrimicrobiaceae bacterium]
LLSVPSMKPNRIQPNEYCSRIWGYINKHKVSLGLFLAAYGVFYLASVVMSDWRITDWGTDTTTYPPFFVNTVLPRSIIAPLFFVTSVPALVIGATMLSVYCSRGLSALTVENRERVSIILTAFGFGYVVIGAWPLGSIVNFPWEWQKQIANNGAIFTWGLYILGIAVLFVGGISLYRCSKIYHQKHPEFSLER